MWDGDLSFMVAQHCFDNATVGSIIKSNGRKYKVTKKTTTAMAVERYYWFDALWDKLIKNKEE